MDSLELPDPSDIAVIGGGPAGTFFSIFALQMARMVDKNLNLTIYEPKDFAGEGPSGCNRCGGVVSELLVQTLAVEGINLPESVVQRGIDSYRLHTAKGSVYIKAPSNEHSIATVYRGGGPKGVIAKGKQSFDGFLLDLAKREGASLRREKVSRVEEKNGRPMLYTRDGLLQKADLVVGAFGVNSPSARVFRDCDFGYSPPKTIKTAIAEIEFKRDIIPEHFGNSIHLFLLPERDIKFAALIPKQTHLTLCVLGKNMSKSRVSDFLSHPVVKGAMPPGERYELSCTCFPKMNVGASPRPYTDRIVMCGDAGSTRLFKDGIGAAYRTGKAAASTAMFHGVGRRHFADTFYKVHRSIVIDNWFGRYLFFITGLYKKHSLMTSGMLRVVEDEQKDPESRRRLSYILWNMFTGSERYKTIFLKAVDLPMHLDLWKEFAGILSGRRP
jgi:flavin-dependent dehydrogenase